ncbi:MAG: hypothetical protein L0H84_06860 [Pseudonocardia sp.]|nr:hypothetical protein [Pseudonocardia sp.]
MRSSECLLSIKEQVDADTRPGRYLVTGSARVLGLRALPDTLAGRTETIELWPFSQGEIDGSADGFVDAAFRDGPAMGFTSAVSRAEYADRIVRGGFPEAVARSATIRRARFFDSYVTDLITRDVSQLSDIERPAEMRALLQLLAARSAQPLVMNTLSNDRSGTGTFRALQAAARSFRMPDAAIPSRPATTPASTDAGQRRAVRSGLDGLDDDLGWGCWPNTPAR